MLVRVALGKFSSLVLTNCVSMEGATALDAVWARPNTSSNGALPEANTSNSMGANSALACKSAPASVMPLVASTRNQRTDG